MTQHTSPAPVNEEVKVENSTNETKESKATRPSNDKDNYPGFLMAIVFGIITIFLSLPIGGLTLGLEKLIPGAQKFTIFINYVLTFGIGFFIARKMFFVKKLNFKATSIVPFLLIIPLTLSLLPISEGLSSLIPMPDFFIEYMKRMIQLDIYGYLTLAIAAPIIEEFIFRGVILKAFLRKYNPTKAIIFSALIFGIVHLNPWQFIPAVIAGSFMGWIYYKTKSLWTTIFMHWLNNSAAFYLSITFNDLNFDAIELIGGWINYLGLLSLSLLVIGGSSYLLKKHFSKPLYNN